MSFEEKINNLIKEAMKAKERERLEALRAIKSAILLERTKREQQESYPKRIFENDIQNG